MIRFYFAGSIRSGRGKAETFLCINELLKQYGIVVDEHVANPNVCQTEQKHSLEYIYNRDIDYLNDCDMVVAEVSTPSLGVGYELCYAQNKGLPIIVLYDETVNVSAMIRGNSYFELIPYSNDIDLLEKLNDKLQAYVENKNATVKK